MKTKAEIERLMKYTDFYTRNFPGMTYEQGVEDALNWVLGEIDDEDFMS